MASNAKSKTWPAETGLFLLVWAGLLALLGLTVAAFMVEMGVWNIVANLAIAVLKAALVVWIFMHVREVRGLVQLFALGALVWIVILFGLTMADYLTRPF